MSSLDIKLEWYCWYWYCRCGYNIPVWRTTFEIFFNVMLYISLQFRDWNAVDLATNSSSPDEALSHSWQSGYGVTGIGDDGGGVVSVKQGIPGICLCTSNLDLLHVGVHTLTHVLFVLLVLSSRKREEI